MPWSSGNARLAGGVQRSGGLVPDTAEEVRERGPAGAEQLLGDVRVAKHARLLLGEDAVARERAQEPVERVRVGAALLCELGHGPRAVGELPGDAQVGDDSERAGDECAAERVPEVGLGRAVCSSAGRADGCRDLLCLGVAERPAVEQEPAVAHDADHRRLAGTQRRGELLLDGAGEARQLGQRERPAADAADRLLDLSAGQLGQPLRPAPHRVRVLERHSQDGHLAERPLRLEVERERPLERRERELVGANGPLERVTAQTLDEVGPADDDPGLRPAEELVAREADEIRAGLEALANRRLLT